MDSPGYIVLSRLVAAQRATAVTANNIANADTPGFRASRPLFGTVLEQQLGAEAPRCGRDLAFAQDRATWREAGAAPLQRTGNPLDLAISAPEGFFAVETPRGERFTAPAASRSTMRGAWWIRRGMRCSAPTTARCGSSRAPPASRSAATAASRPRTARPGGCAW
jgi:flagellar basal body rod protein FlgG